MSMSKSFIGSATNFQQSSVYLERPRLNKILENAVNYPLVTICAGSGYGKTRLIYSFLQKYDAYTTWIQISERDNVVTRFWESYVHTISLSWPEAGARLSKIGFPQTDETFAKFESMMREADSIKGKKHIMVYDDFHLLQNPAVLRFFEKAARILPPNATVILISRIMPEINLVGMMMRERIFTLNEDALCFTEDEIAEYFNDLSLPVTRQDIRDIYDDTRGWAFAVNLIGRSLRKDMKYERYALEAMKANIFKLIETEIFQTVSEPLRRFLLRVSLIDHLAATLIRELAGGDALIKEMELQNAYIRYDSFLNAYVIHHLFLDYLRQSQHILTDKEKRDTCQKAGEWCESNGYQADALSYYEKSGDYDAIMRIVYSFDGQVPYDMAKYALEIFDRIPEEAASGHPLFPSMYLKLKIGLGMLEEASALAEKYAKDYEARPESAEKNRALLGIYCAWALLRLTMCPYTNAYDFDEYFKKLDEYCIKSPFTEFGPSTNQSIGSWVIIVGESRKGAPEEYIEAATRSIPYVSHALNGNMYGFDDLARGELCYFRREINEAEKHLKQALDKARSKKQYDIQNRSLFYLMNIGFARGDYNAATAALKSMEELLGEKDYLVRYTTYDIARGFYYIALCQPKQVPEWLKGDFSRYTHPALLENHANRVRSLYHYQTRQYGILLAFIENERMRQPTLFGKIGMNVIEALSLYQLKRKDEAFAALAESYRLAEPNNIIAPFIQYGKDMRTLASAAIGDGKCPIPADWLENINRKASAFAKKQAHMISEYKRANNLAEGVALTKRETEILKDLSLGLSRTEIAASQNISVNTVKMVVNIIYDKLCANNLVDAVRIAADNKII